MTEQLPFTDPPVSSPYSERYFALVDTKDGQRCISLGRHGSWNEASDAAYEVNKQNQFFGGYWVLPEDELRAMVASIVASLDDKVVIEVNSGVADVAERPDYMRVDIIDYDDESTCPECAEVFHGDLSEETSISDHGRCINCQKLWQFGELEWQQESEE
jgi:hypothetical protein